MSHADQLDVTLETDKPSYAIGEVPQYAATVKTKSGGPVYADLEWGLKEPGGDWVEYSREYPVHTSEDTGEARWRWPDGDYGPPETPGEWGLYVIARASDNGPTTGEGEAELTYRIGD